MKNSVFRTPVLPLTRRAFIRLSGISTAALLSGCATDPVTGRRQFMLITEDYEIQIDKESSPHQFSSDYGALQDRQVNDYVNGIGLALAAKSHRPQMPYSFRGVNAVYVNAYTFPAGSVAVTRGMLAGMESEAELAAVLGHEIGHVNARHTAEHMTKGLIFGSMAALTAAVIAQQEEDYGDLAAGLGMIATGALLARYSRQNEREADSLGMKYMTEAGYNPEGFTDLMNMLVEMSKTEPSVIELLFATHPMSTERYDTALRAARETYASKHNQPIYRERYMDNIASIRKQKTAIDYMQKGQKALSANNMNEAVDYFKDALKASPDDYTGLLLMAKCNLVRKDYAEAEKYAGQARAVYPSEGQAVFVTGLARMHGGKFQSALTDFSRYDTMLPGNPNTLFLKGFSYEGMKKRDQAAEHYYAYLQKVQQGEYAQHAYNRLVEWGYIKPQAS